MASPPRRPSLPQARELPSHAHSSRNLRHLLGHDQHYHEHQHPHESVSSPGRDGDCTADDQQIHNRAAFLTADLPASAVAPTPTAPLAQAIQTLSLVQVGDASGSPAVTQARFSLPSTAAVDTGSGKTVAISRSDTTTLAAPGSSPGPSSRFSSSSISLSSKTMPAQVAGTVSTSASLAPIPPSTHLSTFLKLSNIHNATKTRSAPRGTTSPFFAASKNATLSTTSSSASTTLSFTSSTRSSSTSYSASLSNSIFSKVSSFDSVATDGAANGGVSGDGSAGHGSAGDGSQPTSSTSPASNINLTPQEKQVIGGVVGGVAGVAFFAVLVLLVFRYKRRQNNRALLGTHQSGVASRALPPGGPGRGDGDGSGVAMTERHSPAAITAALAGLAAKKNSRTSNTTDSSERGFYRVSGRKLPSVLQEGGDGYSDPRESVMSGNSDYYRGSQAFEPVEGGLARLALGGPMRPVSGVPIFRAGPARTAVTERNPFADPPSIPPGDAPVPSLAPRDSPRGLGSRFQESI